MKRLHIELGGKTFPCSNKVVKIKKNKNPIPRWDERLKAFRKKRKKKKKTKAVRERVILLSSQNSQLRPKLTAGSRTSQRSALA